MSIIVRDSGDIYFDGTNNVSVMSIFVDSAADLSGLVQYEDIHFLLGSDALDVSTGNKYRMKSDGTWVLQPDNMWQNVYTKQEIDAIIASQDAKIYGHDSVQVNLSDVTWTRSGGGLYYSSLITTMTLTKIYALSISGFANISDTDIITPACNRTGGWRGFRLYANKGTFASGAWITISGVGEV